MSEMRDPTDGEPEVIETDETVEVNPVTTSMQMMIDTIPGVIVNNLMRVGGDKNDALSVVENIAAIVIMHLATTGNEPVDRSVEIATEFGTNLVDQIKQRQADEVAAMGEPS